MDPVREQLQQALGQTYRLDRELGGGGMSRVFLATETALDRQVVLKVLPPELADGVSVERFKREISLAARLQHAHIMPLLSTGDAHGLPWFAMPFVEGESLRTRLGHGELPIADVVRTLRDVAGALAYAHARGIVHRDIKPENILLAEGSAVVTDFGVAKALLAAGDAQGNTLTSVGVALGTPAYMSPEQIAGDPRTDHRADLYALGVVAYEMLGGHNPFAGRSPQATMAAHMTEAPVPVERLRSATPPALAALVHRCMEKSAADRPQTAQDIVNALDGLVTPVGTVPSIQRNAGAHPSTRARSARVAATALGAVVIISGAWYATRNARTVEVSARRVAVVPFENLTGDTNLTVIGRVASRELSRSIELTDSADVVAASVAELAADGGRGGEAAVVERVARATGAAMIVVGSYTKSGDSLRMVASLVDARTGKHVGGLDPSAGPLNEPMVAIEGLRERLLGSMVSGDLARKAAVAARAPKFSAYVEFLDGVREFSRDQPASRPYFERAIAIDPGFVDAHIYLATTYRNARLYDSAQRVIQQLNKQREHFSSTDRAAAQYGTASLYGDAAEALRLSRELARRTSDPLWSYLSGYWSLAMVRADTAAEAFLRSDSAMVTAGWAPYIFQAAWAQHLLGHYQKEMALLDHGIVRLPRSAEGYTGTRLRPLAGLRNLPVARALADTILKRSEPGTPTGLLSVLAAAREFDVHGDTAGAHILNRAAIDWARSNAPRVRSLPWEQAVGCMWLFAGALDSAAVHFARAVPDTSAERVGTVAYLAMIAARRGNSARARTVSDSLAANVRTWDRGRTPFWRAAIASELGERAQAVRLLTVAAKQGVLMWTWHSELALRALHGFPPYEVLIKPRS